MIFRQAAEGFDCQNSETEQEFVEKTGLAPTITSTRKLLGTFFQPSKRAEN